MTTPVGKGPVGKGRPTPKRSATSRRRTGPVAPPPRTRKEAAKRAREQAVLARTQARAGAVPDGEHPLARDRGPVRALVRDVVDARRNVGVLLLPLALLVVLAQLTGIPRLIAFVFLLFMASAVALVVDVVLTTLAIRRRVRADFPEEGRLVGHVGYGLLRSTVFRRFRMPAARVSPGRGAA